MIVCEQIRKVKGGYIVVVRAPYGDNCNAGEVICSTFDDVVKLLREAALVDVKA